MKILSIYILQIGLKTNNTLLFLHEIKHNSIIPEKDGVSLKEIENF